MSRVNAGIPPRDLCRQHLLAEAREMKRIPNAVGKGKFNMKGQPKEFTLGTGHVKFFYDKLLFLKKRYEEVYAECLARGYNATYFGGAWDNVPIKYMNDYIPTERDRKIVQARIDERLAEMAI